MSDMIRTRYFALTFGIDGSMRWSTPKDTFDEAMSVVTAQTKNGTAGWGRVQEIQEAEEETATPESGG